MTLSLSVIKFVEEILNNNKRSWYSITLQFKMSKYPEKFKYIELPNFEMAQYKKKHGKYTNVNES